MVRCRLSRRAVLPSAVFLEFDCDGGEVVALIDPVGCEVRSYDADPTGMGFGSAAWPLVEEEFRRAGCSSVSLVPYGNAVSFWRKMGFRDLGIRAGMRKEIG